MSARKPGTVVAGRYRLERLLGEGGMGEVWSAKTLADDRPIALKFMKTVIANFAEMFQRFEREAVAASAVKHPCVVKIHEVLRDDDDTPVMVMDLLLGESLAEKLHREGALALPDFARIFLQILSAVGTAHAVGVVHRDLKPDNVFLVKDGGDAEVRILDFGIAKLTAFEGEAQPGLTSTGALLGTPHYMSPEQVFGDKTIDHRSDIWALGVIMYECLTGTRPVRGDNVGQILRVITSHAIVPLDQIAPTLPAPILDLSRRMLAYTRGDRPSDLRGAFDVVQKYTTVPATRFDAATVEISAAEMQAALQSGGPLAPATSLSMTSTGVPLTSNRRPLLALAVVLALGGFGIVLATRDDEHAKTPRAQTPTSAITGPSVVEGPSASPTTLVTVSSNALGVASGVVATPRTPSSTTTQTLAVNKAPSIAKGVSPAPSIIPSATTTLAAAPPAPSPSRPPGTVATELPF
jgi:eukaryotic-like serine/threonine-protein kinase